MSRTETNQKQVPTRPSTDGGRMGEGSERRGGASEQSCRAGLGYSEATAWSAVRAGGGSLHPPAGVENDRTGEGERVGPLGTH